jgi:hypothetical protein
MTPSLSVITDSLDHPFRANVSNEKKRKKRATNPRDVEGCNSNEEVASIIKAILRRVGPKAKYLRPTDRYKHKADETRHFAHGRLMWGEHQHGTGVMVDVASLNSTSGPSTSARHDKEDDPRVKIDKGDVLAVKAGDDPNLHSLCNGTPCALLCTPVHSCALPVHFLCTPVQVCSLCTCALPVHSCALLCTPVHSLCIPVQCTDVRHRRCLGSSRNRC